MMMILRVMMMIDDSSQSQQKWFDWKKYVWRKVLRLNWMCLWADSWPIPIVRMCKSLLLSLATFIFIESLKPKLKMCVSVSTNLKSNDQDEETWDGCLTPMMVSSLAPVAWHMIFIHLGWKIRENARNESIRSIAPQHIISVWWESLRKSISHSVGPQQTITIQYNIGGIWVKIIVQFSKCEINFRFQVSEVHSTKSDCSICCQYVKVTLYCCLSIYIYECLKRCGTRKYSQ